MKPYDRLLYWIKERHSIHTKRFPKGYDAFLKHWVDQEPRSYVETSFSAGVETERPWTEDPILQTIFFCNPYRENDKVTAYLRYYFREEHSDDTCVFLGTILLRWFNYIPTMHFLIANNIPQRMGRGVKKDLSLLDEALEGLSIRRDQQNLQLFGGAYIIKLFNGMGKLEAIIQVMKELASLNLYKSISVSSFAQAHKSLTSIPGFGNFYVYQFLGDLAYTHVLPNNTSDWWTWSFCGPGTSRGIYRLKGMDRQMDGTPWERRVNIPRDWEKFCLDLQEKLNKDLKAAKLPKMHMRDLTNCLCEYDKYCRALDNERDIKRGYPGI